MSSFFETSFRVWPAPGFEDTELGVWIGPEVRHGEAEVEIKLEAVRLINDTRFLRKRQLIWVCISRSCAVGALLQSQAPTLDNAYMSPMEFERLA